MLIIAKWRGNLYWTTPYSYAIGHHCKQHTAARQVRWNWLAVLHAHRQRTWHPPTQISQWMENYRQGGGCLSQKRWIPATLHSARNLSSLIQFSSPLHSSSQIHVSTIVSVGPSIPIGHPKAYCGARCLQIIMEWCCSQEKKGLLCKCALSFPRRVIIYTYVHCQVKIWCYFA